MKYSAIPTRSAIVAAAAALCVGCVDNTPDFYTEQQVRPIQRGEYRSMDDCRKDWHDSLCERPPAGASGHAHPVVGPYFFNSGSASHVITPAGTVQPFTHNVANAANTTTASRTVASVYNTPGNYSAGQSRFAATRAAAVSRGGMASSRGGSSSGG